MYSDEILSRRLDPVSCKIVGAKIKAHVLSLREKEKNFSEKLSKATDDFVAVVDALIRDIPDGVSIRTIDPGADQCFGGFRSLLEGVANSLHHVDYLPISDLAFQRGENARKLLALAYPNGTGYLKDKYDIQWAEMVKLVHVLASEVAKPLIDFLQVHEEVNRLSQWTTLYGEKRNITTDEDASTKKAQDLVERWHKSYAKLLAQALAFYDDDDNKEHIDKRGSFVAPYQEHLEKLREEDRARREELKKKRETPSPKAPGASPNPGENPPAK